MIRSDSAAPCLHLRTVEVSAMAQGTVSVSHTRTGYSQSRALGPVGTEGTDLSASVDYTDLDFGVGGNAGSLRLKYVHDARGQVKEDQKQYLVSGSTYANLTPVKRTHADNDIGGCSGSSGHIDGRIRRLHECGGS